MGRCCPARRDETLTLKNSDKKIIAGTWLHRLKQPFMSTLRRSDGASCRPASFRGAILTLTSRPALTARRCPWLHVEQGLAEWLHPFGPPM